MQERAQRDGSMRSPVQRELDDLERRARLSPWRVQRSGIVSSCGCSWVWALLIGFLVQQFPSLQSLEDAGIPIAAIAGTVAFLILMLNIRFNQFPAIVRRQAQLVKELRKLLFEQEIFREFLESIERKAPQGEESPAALVKSIHGLALPLQPKGLLSRFAAFAAQRALKLPEYAHYRGDIDELELRCALQLAIVEELRRDHLSELIQHEQEV